MTGASIEATLDLWASSLREVKARIRSLFSQERVAVSDGLFLDGLLGPEPAMVDGGRNPCHNLPSPPDFS